MNMIQAPPRKNAGNRGLWGNILLYTVVILLASAAYFLEPDYMAHVPIRIGISSCDSVFAAPVLERYADLVREKGGGDIRWFYFDEDEYPEGCDFYLMTADLIITLPAQIEYDSCLIRARIMSYLSNQL